MRRRMSAGRDAKLAPLPRATPEHIGRYRIIGHLAAGGMAELLLAKLVSLNGFERPVVVKRILPHLARDDEFVNMFLDEARITVGIQHPNVVRVEELGRVDGELFLVMEYLNGETLLGLMRRLAPTGDAIGCALATHIVAEACAGLQAAHDLVGADGQPARLVHRDVSPDNLFITYDGTVKLLDFGIATATDVTPDQRLTRAGFFVGTLMYVAPEALSGEVVSPAADQYSLATMAYLFLAGTLPYTAKSPREMFTQLLSQPPVPLNKAKPEIVYAPAVEAVVMKGLAKAPGDRYADVTAFAEALAEVLQDPFPSSVTKDASSKDASSGLLSRMKGLFGR